MLHFLSENMSKQPKSEMHQNRRVCYILPKPVNVFQEHLGDVWAAPGRDLGYLGSSGRSQLLKWCHSRTECIFSKKTSILLCVFEGQRLRDCYLRQLIGGTYSWEARRRPGGGRRWPGRRWPAVGSAGQILNIPGTMNQNRQNPYIAISVWGIINLY